MSDPTPQEQAALAIENTDNAPAVAEELVEDELLVEDVSIDGMCGVY